jgi:ribonuclease HI
MDLLVNTDGASRGNPGKSSYGFVIKVRGGAILHEEGKTIGIATNNTAEYMAVVEALRYIKNRWGAKGPHLVEVEADSKLVVEQLSGNFKLKKPHLKVLFDQIKLLEMELGTVFYKHIPRGENFIADRLANQALDRK